MNQTPSLSLRALGATGLLVLAPALAAAQLPQASAAAVGMGDNYTAVARGFSAVSWNPANLALAGNPPVFVAILGLSGIAGLDPITPADFTDFEGTVIPQNAKVEWLERIREAGGERGSAGAEVTFIAASVGRVGVQLSTAFHTVGDLAPEAAELILFGNAGLTGEPEDISTSGSTFDMTVATTGALSYAHPIELGGGRRLAVGAALKYTVGHVAFTGEDLGSAITTDPLAGNVRFPVIAIDTTPEFNAGSGVGLDVGASWEQENWTAGVTVRNVFNSFEWDASKLVFVPGTVAFNADTTSSDFELRPATEAPAPLLDRLGELKYSPVVSAGVAYRRSRRVLLSADVRTATGDGLHVGPKSQAGVGAELRLIPGIPLRAGAAYVSGGYKLSGGIGVEAGPVNLNFGGSVREDEFGSGGSGMVLLSFRAR